MHTPPKVSVSQHRRVTATTLQAQQATERVLLAFLTMRWYQRWWWLLTGRVGRPWRQTPTARILEGLCDDCRWVRQRVGRAVRAALRWPGKGAV